jgi:hypothetical protein
MRTLILALLLVSLPALAENRRPGCPSLVLDAKLVPGTTVAVRDIDGGARISAAQPVNLAPNETRRLYFAGK